MSEEWVVITESGAIVARFSDEETARWWAQNHTIARLLLARGHILLVARVIRHNWPLVFPDRETVPPPVWKLAREGDLILEEDEDGKIHAWPVTYGGEAFAPAGHAG